MGGQFVNNINDAEIVLTNGENKKEEKINNSQILNIKWLFDCYFYFKKCDKNLQIYQEM